VYGIAVDDDAGDVEGGTGSGDYDLVHALEAVVETCNGDGADNGPWRLQEREDDYKVESDYKDDDGEELLVGRVQKVLDFGVDDEDDCADVKERVRDSGYDGEPTRLDLGSLNSPEKSTSRNCTRDKECPSSPQLLQAKTPDRDWVGDKGSPNSPHLPPASRASLSPTSAQSPTPGLGGKKTRPPPIIVAPYSQEVPYVPRTDAGSSGSAPSTPYKSSTGRMSPRKRCIQYSAHSCTLKILIIYCPIRSPGQVSPYSSAAGSRHNSPRYPFRHRLYTHILYSSPFAVLSLEWPLRGLNKVRLLTAPLGDQVHRIVVHKHLLKVHRILKIALLSGYSFPPRNYPLYII
jgi:hypothetical protein